ncbi:hypothetical protein ACFP81_03730 [Deinococcus lacus]|uniref:Uncharacterized protein n=1 Tax=Deinococcus lacus TaxID=392561 RepID=A0ABW1YA99_9DEIO
MLASPPFSERMALILRGYDGLLAERPRLGTLAQVLLDAQRARAEQGAQLWLLAEEPESDLYHW